jgi:hypothetical protein
MIWRTREAGRRALALKSEVERFGGPARDRTDDLDHAMEVKNLPAIDSKETYDWRNGSKPYYLAQFATKLLPKN